MVSKIIESYKKMGYKDRFSKNCVYMLEKRLEQFQTFSVDYF